MIHRPSVIRLALPGLLLVFGLAACSSTATDLLGAAAAAGTPAAVQASPAAAGTPAAASTPAAAPSAERTSGGESGGAGDPGGGSLGKQPGTIVCGPQTPTMVGLICVAPAEELFVAAAERALSPAEMAATIGARVSQGAAACAAIALANCSTNPPAAVVSFAQSSGPAIVVIVRRGSSGQLEGERA